MRLANVGRSLLFAAALVAAGAWTDGVHLIGLLVLGLAAFPAGLAVFEGGDWWIRHRGGEGTGRS
ncbi:hypothetical protein GA0115240_14212 [Streptomyces sp. DvalAA-14]|uniref:hypothetical protein n=1 Tax=unclassified Streptomyces TaxID=2593676 RepID=UPI00081B5F4E|nr:MULTISPECIES: hypothetical protein [unclassified Streptomyces]MYS22449.1 hypothetical protein [Streptomyces sp. SID4948]SCE16616.1 hypothetical protein GA0115240_14212 [Streptomyces sp. DvalAA-14]